MGKNLSRDAAAMVACHASGPEVFAAISMRVRAKTRILAQEQPTVRRTPNQTHATQNRSTKLCTRANERGSIGKNWHESLIPGLERQPCDFKRVGEVTGFLIRKFHVQASDVLRELEGASV